jgi:xylulokinase
MNDNFFIGIDVGTSSVKGVMTDDVGKILSLSVREYVLEEQGNRCELDAGEYWEKSKAVIHDLLQGNVSIKGQVRALSFSSQGETLICVDQNGMPLRKAIVWLDNRSTEEALEIQEKFGAEEICYHTGQPQVQPRWPATRIAWLRKHEQHVFEKVNKFLLVEDYLIYRLTGKYATEHTMVSSTLYYDIRSMGWWQPMLQYLGITKENLPDVLPSGTEIGTILEFVATETGLSPSTHIVTGAYDHVAGALGAGNFIEGSVSETTGTAMAMAVTLDRVIPNYVINIPMQCHAIPGKYLLLPYGQTAGFVLKWFKDQFCEDDLKRILAKGEDVYERLTSQAEQVPPGAEGLIMLPHLLGTGSPEFDTKAKGVFAGITSGTKRGHFIRAILEAVACMMKRNLDALRTSGIVVKEVKTLGGGSKSKLWNQIKADVSNLPITTVQGQETTALGAAILAAAGSGFFSSLECACKKMVQPGHTYVPDQHQHKIYQEVYARYVNLTHTLEKFWSL